MPSYDHPHPRNLSSPVSATYSNDHEAPRPSSPGRLLLKPEDAISLKSPSRKQARHRSSVEAGDGGSSLSPAHSSSRKRSLQQRGASSSSRRRKAPWKKLLWVKQDYPDNYTDEETFLDHLQRNPRWQSYEFWPLVSDSTVIVQHLCSVVIFICCFTAIFQERVSPRTVVGWATVGTVVGWIIRDYWQSREKAETVSVMKSRADANKHGEREQSVTSGTDNAIFGMPFQEVPTTITTTASTTLGEHHSPPYTILQTNSSSRMQERLTTIKSAVLIYFSLLGLSPILKSLTQSTSSDSIWAMSSWLMGINVFTFDYGAGPEAKFPASLPTNAALMASTVLASRLPSTTHVFSLTLFSIEVFGLFPVFRRHLRHHSWVGHLWLTFLLVIVSTGALGMTISGGGWAMGLVGAVLGSIITCLSMGLTSWWLIGLQRYKNEIHGPWDPARPVIRRHWD